MQILPFAALRYRPALSPQDVLTQPYDKITPEMQAAYYARSPYNLVRIVLGRSEPGDQDEMPGGPNRYQRARHSYEQWKREGVLAADPSPAIYSYSQTFTIPGSGDGLRLTRRGFIALGRLHDYQDGVVLRHEQTLSKPKADRLQLLRATAAHFELLFMLYDDPARALEGFAGRDLPRQAEVSVQDEYGVLHQLWSITDPFVIEAITGAMRDKPVVIADGHHRYETALAYRQERGQAGGGGPVDFAPMAFFNMAAPELVILPTHRVLSGLEQFEAENFLRQAACHFAVHELPADAAPGEIAARLREAGEQSNAFVLVTAGGAHLLRLRPEGAEKLLGDLPAQQRGLDVLLLHRVLLEGMLGLSQESMREQKNLDYVRDAGEAVERVRRGHAQAAFLMNPARIEQVRDVALARQVMPQKSTDFYPKLLSGLVVYEP